MIFFLNFIASCCYVSSYFLVDSEIVLFLSILLIIFSYRQILKNLDFTPILIMIFYSRTIVGYSSGHNVVLYSILNIFVNYLPVILYGIRADCKPQSGFIYTKLYLIFCLISIVIFDAWSSASFAKRFIPLLFFSSLTFRRIHLSVKSVDVTFKLLFMSSLLVWLSKDYGPITSELLQGGFVFPKESDFVPLIGDSFRVMGPFFDPRIFGLILNLALVFFLTKEKFFLDYLMIVLIVLLLFFTISRGSIITAAMLLCYTIWKFEKRIYFWLFTGGLFLTVYAFSSEIFAVYDVVFNAGGVNPLEQRSGFIWTGLDLFLTWPFGYGFGYLSNLPFPVLVGDAYYYFITDAFFSIQLVELGFFGFVLFLLSFYEMFFNNKYSKHIVVLGVGILMQLIGTDIPDFGMFYFIFLMIIRYHLESRNLFNDQILLFRYK